MMPSSATSSAAAIAQRYVFAGMAICVTMTAGTLWMPALLGALSQGYGLGTRALSHLAFAEVLGFLLGTLFTSAKTVRELKQWVLIGCALVIGANVILLLLAPAVPFMALRPIAGLGAGLGYGYVLKVCSASARPTRSFGLFTASTSIFMILGFQVVAYLIETRATINGVADADSVKSVAKIIFGIYATFAAAAAVILLTNQPPSTVQPGQVQPQARGALSASVLICLLAVVLSFIGQGAIWAFLQTLGISHGFSVAGVANAMSALAITGIVGSLSAAALPSTVSRTAAIGSALVLLWIGLFALYAPASLAWYIAGCAIGGFYWNFTFSLILGLLARIDHTGRGPVLGGTVAGIGTAVGPLFAGLLIQGTNYRPVGWMVGAVCAAGLVGIWIVERRNRTAAPLSQTLERSPI